MDVTVTGWRENGPCYDITVSYSSDPNTFSADTVTIVRSVTADGNANKHPKYAYVSEDGHRFLLLFGTFKYAVTTKARGSIGTYVIRNPNNRSKAYELLPDEQVLSVEVVPGKKMRKKLGPKRPPGRPKKTSVGA